MGLLGWLLGDNSSNSQEQNPSVPSGPVYHVVVLNDDSHSYQYVVDMLGDVCGMPPEEAYTYACAIDIEWKAVVFAGALSEAERVRDQIANFGPDPTLTDSLDSMQAIIERAE